MNREIEKKYTIQMLMSDESLDTLIMTNIVVKDFQVGSNLDYYWKNTFHPTISFVRLRYLSDAKGGGELTYKFKDQGTNENREELNVRVDDPSKLLRILKKSFGGPAGVIEKEYSKFDLGEWTELSVSKIKGDHRRFLEVEANTIERVEAAVEKLQKFLTLKAEPLSLYELFILRKVN